MTRNDQGGPGKRTIILVNKQEPFYYEISVYYTLIDSSKQPKIIKISFEIYDLVKENDIIFFSLPDFQKRDQIPEKRT